MKSIAGRKFFDVRVAPSEAMLELAEALACGNVQAFVGVVYLADGDTLRFGDLGGVDPVVVRADAEGLLNDLTG